MNELPSPAGGCALLVDEVEEWVAFSAFGVRCTFCAVGGAIGALAAFVESALWAGI